MLYISYSFLVADRLDGDMFCVPFHSRALLPPTPHHLPAVSITPSLKIKSAEKWVVPIQLIFCLK
jgi:hypothetical protein